MDNQSDESDIICKDADLGRALSNCLEMTDDIYGMESFPERGRKTLPSRASLSSEVFGATPIPVQPKHRLFQFQPSTLFCDTGDGIRIAEEAYAFLLSEGCEIKVNQMKKSLKAFVIRGKTYFRLKMRLYQMADRVAIEFRMLNGCLFSFKSFYSELIVNLKRMFSIEAEIFLTDESLEDIILHDSSSDDAVCKSEIDEENELLSRVCISDFTNEVNIWRQIEAAQQLSQCVYFGGDQTVPATLQNKEFMHHLSKALSSSQMELAAMTAVLLIAIVYSSSYEKSEQSIATNIMFIMIDCLETASSSFVLKEVSSAFSISCRKFRTVLAESVQRQLAMRVTALLKSRNDLDFCVKCNVGDGQRSLL